MDVSYSQLAEWFSCRYKHNLSYRIGYRSKIDAPALQLGTLVHAGIAAHLNQETVFAQIELVTQNYIENLPVEIDTDEVWERSHTAYEIVMRLVEWLEPYTWETLHIPNPERPENGLALIEQTLTVPLFGEHRFKFICDWAAQQNNINWLVDFKTRKYLSSDEHEETGLQYLSYVHGLRALGVAIQGVRIVQIRSDLPAQPSLNKDGSMSRRKISTDWATYKQALIDQGLDPADYSEMQDKLDTQWFKMTELVFSDEEVDAAWNEIIVPAAREMIEHRGPYYRSMTPWNCRYCAYREVCLSELRGYDYEYLLNTNFERKER